MARKIFIAATGQNSGKTTVSLSLMHLAQKKYKKVGFMKPLGPKPAVLNGVDVDKDAALMAQVFKLTRDLRYMSPVVVHPHTTRQVLDGQLDPGEMRQRIVHACAELEKRCELIIIEGSGHPGVGSVLRLSNAHIARMLDAPVLMVTGGGIGNVIDSVYANLAIFEKQGAEVRAILPNKLIPEKRDITLDYLRRAFAGEPFPVLGGFNYQPVLANPTLGRIGRILDLPLNGNKREAKRIVHHVQIGAASTQRVAELLKEATGLIVTSSRDELLVTLANMYQIPEYREKIVGLIIPGILPVSKITQQILDRSNIPYLRAQKHTTAELYKLITEDVSKLTAEDTEKLDLVRSLAEFRFDFDTLDELFAPRPG
ncbi:cobyrinic acid a,c-diamide synthase [Desulfuromonas versatilis]|uniref:Cobyrinic acid a,c-diamide synthase n=1 Tax=Desulfuromonas versatilis TaxID=2802975 RepID=A0ABM8HZL7_9BACT|nr:AAA family ATPase [Desulfuromonas versatilis]BCR06233.1 cobyrinic acid a,c-diamide synthase [Desulfuromonas versatilis]